VVDDIWFDGLQIIKV